MAGGPWDSSDNREIQRGCCTGYVEVTLQVNRNRHSLIHAAASKVRGVQKDRIDDQRQPAIVRAQCEADLVAAQQSVTAGYAMTDSTLLLIDERGMLSNGGIPGLCEENTVRQNLQSLDTIELQNDLRRIGAWRNDEVVFHFPLSWMEAHIDSFVERPIRNALVERNVEAPAAGVRAAQVIGARNRRSDRFSADAGTASIE